MTMSSVPSSMIAIAIRVPGPAQVLVPETRPVPEPKEGEILVKVHAAGINRPDILQREGAYPPPPGAPDIPGLEIAGEIFARGPRATKHLVGDKICALVPGGGYAEYCTVHETNALKIPAGMKYVDAAGIPETYFTVWTNVFERGRLQEGETFLVHGGTSGIGTTAIMLAKAFGARVIATAGSDEKCESIMRLGADLAINYRTMDFVAEVKSFTDGAGANVILDMVGGDYVQKNYSAAARDGRIVEIAFQKGSRVEIDMMPLMLKRLTHTGSTLRPRSVAEKAVIADALHKQVWPLLEAGRCRPLIHAVFPLEEAAKAHEMMESGAHTGKIILQVIPSP
jgi:NADPH2:quinone reductase